MDSVAGMEETGGWWVDGGKEKDSPLTDLSDEY